MQEIPPKSKHYQELTNYSENKECYKMLHTLLDAIDHYISQTSLKRVKGFGTVGLSSNTVRTYRSLRRTIDLFQTHKGQKIFTNKVDKDLGNSISEALKVSKQSNRIK